MLRTIEKFFAYVLLLLVAIVAAVNIAGFMCAHNQPCDMQSDIPLVNFIRSK